MEGYLSGSSIGGLDQRLLCASLASVCLTVSLLCSHVRAKCQHGTITHKPDSRLFHAVQGLALVLLVFQWIEAISCDLRMGTMVATIENAAPELGSFFILFFILLLLMAAMGHILLGTYLWRFSTFHGSVGSVFTCMVAGDLSGVNQLVRPPMYNRSLEAWRFVVLNVSNVWTWGTCAVHTHGFMTGS